jgi:hypothetical protein
LWEARGAAGGLVTIDPVGEMERINRIPTVQDASKQYRDCVIGRAVQMARVSEESAEPIARAALGGCAPSPTVSRPRGAGARYRHDARTSRAGRKRDDWRARWPSHRRPRRHGRRALRGRGARRDCLRRERILASVTLTVFPVSWPLPAPPRAPPRSRATCPPNFSPAARFQRIAEPRNDRRQRHDVFMVTVRLRYWILATAITKAVEKGAPKAADNVIA